MAPLAIGVIALPEQVLYSISCRNQNKKSLKYMAFFIPAFANVQPAVGVRDNCKCSTLLNLLNKV